MRPIGDGYRMGRVVNRVMVAEVVWYPSITHCCVEQRLRRLHLYHSAAYGCYSCANEFRIYVHIKSNLLLYLCKVLLSEKLPSMCSYHESYIPAHMV